MNTLYYGTMVTMPDVGRGGACLIIAEFIPFFFKIVYYCVRHLDTTDNKRHTNSAGGVLQLAGYRVIHAHRLPAEQEAT